MELMPVMALLLMLCVVSLHGALAQSGFRVLTGEDASTLKLEQSEGNLAIAARTGETIYLNFTGAQMAVVFQEDVNVVLDCLPWLQQFPGGAIGWRRTQLDEFGVEGTTKELQRGVDGPVSPRLIVTGDFNHILNITQTMVGGEDPDSGIYQCEVCFTDLASELEVCNVSNATLWGIGSPPVIDSTGNDSGPDGISGVLGGLMTVTYRIGADFCISENEVQRTRLRLTLRCDIEDRVPGVTPLAFPIPDRTWMRNAVELYTAQDGQSPAETILESNFFMEGRNFILFPGVVEPSNPLIASNDGALVFSTLRPTDNLTTDLAELGITSTNFRRRLFEQILGTWSCSVSNSIGRESVQSFIRECAFDWVTGEFSDCFPDCREGVRLRSVVCRNLSDNSEVSDILCTNPEPVSTENCSDFRDDPCHIETPGFFDLDTELEMLLAENITEDNYNTVVAQLNMLASTSVAAIEEQTSENLNRITTAFNSLADLLAEDTSTLIVEDNAVEDLVETLDSILQWDDEVLAANGSAIVEDFEVIAAAFADQPIVGEITFTTQDVAFVAENRELESLEVNGRSFSSSDRNGVSNVTTGNEMDTPTTLEPNQTAFINLPATLFSRHAMEGNDNVGIFFTVYKTPSLFPVASQEAGIGRSPREVRVLTTVLAASVVNTMVENLTAPVAILLRLQALEEDEVMSFGSERCVSWDFNADGGRGNWTSEGCETISLVDGVATCECNHLTNFAILVDICARINSSRCTSPPSLKKALEVLTIVGVSLSLTGLVLTIFALLMFKKLRNRDYAAYHIQLCIAMICMLVVFVVGINRTEVYGGCVAVSVLIHYFTLVAVLWMTAEAILMFQKLVIVFVDITAKFIVAISIVCWFTPLIPVVIPLIVDLITQPNQDIIVNRRNFCFLSNPGAFFGAFLAPVFILTVVNAVIFISVIVVVIRHTKDTIKRNQKGFNTATATRLLINFIGIMFVFGLTWLFGALTITIQPINDIFQVLFVIFNSLQGFFIFLFFCVLSKEARESWKELLSCGHYKSELLRPSHAKSASAGNQEKSRDKKPTTGSTGVELMPSNSSDTLPKGTLEHQHEANGECSFRKSVTIVTLFLKEHSNTSMKLMAQCESKPSWGT